MSKPTLKDYMELAYEFAIRNPRVVELLSSELTDETVYELKKFGINATAYYNSQEHNEEGYENTIRELYLDYKHLEHLNHSPCSFEEPNDSFNGNKLLIQPENKTCVLKLIGISEIKENDIEALLRISNLIEKRGAKEKRLLNGSAFENFDKNVFEKCSIYSIDPSTKTKKTINSDIKFIKEWIQQEKYFQLLPQYIN